MPKEVKPKALSKEEQRRKDHSARRKAESESLVRSVTAKAAGRRFAQVIRLLATKAQNGQLTADEAKLTDALEKCHARYFVGKK